MKTNMKTRRKTALVLSCFGFLVGAPIAQADSFTGFTMDFVDIGNAGNAADDTTYGAVDYNYRMGTHEVSETMIDSYNTANPSVLITKLRRGDDRPATGVSWNEAARFVNWLNTSTGHAEAYKFTTGGTNDNISLWTAGDAGFDASNPFRNSNAHYILPTEDEWYKAAYYDPNTSTYNDYATGSDTAPTATSGSTTDGEAVYDGQSASADITNAGGLSPYGTMAQNGNVWELSESNFTAPNDSPDEERVARGSYWGGSSVELQPSVRTRISPTSSGNGVIGFRVASVVPEPSSISLVVIGAVGLLMKRRRG